MAAGRRRRLKKSVKRFLFANMGIILGLITAFRVNAEAPATDIAIEEGTVSIDDYEYFKSYGLIGVHMPSSLQQVGFSAFEGCTSLKDLDFSDNLKVIDNRAFAKCTAIKELAIPDSVVFVGNAAFYGCENMEKVTLPSTINEISNNLFYGCSSLKEIIIPDGVETIGQQSFYNCVRLKEIVIPDGVTRIGDGAFYDCVGLNKIVIPASVTYIGTDAFLGCDNLVIEAERGSYAEDYAKTNHFDGRKTEVTEVVMMSGDTDNPNVPATGVDTPYIPVMLIMIFAGLGLIYCRKKELCL